MKSVDIAATGVAGLKVIREKPLVWLAWAAVQLAFLGINFGLGLSVGMTAEQNLTGAAPPATGAMLGQFILYYIGVLLLAIINAGISTTAIYRAVLEPDNSRFAYLRFGREELRQMAVFVTIGVTMALAYFAVAIGGGMLMMFVSMLSPVVGALLMFSLMVSVMALLATRLSLAGPQTFARKRLNIFGTWSLTDGHAWRLLLGYVIAILIVIAVILVLIVLAVIAVVAVAGPQALQDTWMGTQALASSPVLMGLLIAGYAIVMPLATAFSNVVAQAPQAAAYKQLTGHGVAEVF